MTQEEYIDLYEKMCAGKCTPEEQALLDEYSENFLTDGPWHPAMGDESEIEERINNSISSSIHSVKIRRVITRWAAAAVILVCAGAALWKTLQSPQEPQQSLIAKQKTVKQPGIVPGSTKAILTLANGKSIVLDSANNGIISTQGNTQVVKLSNGKLAYHSTNGDSSVITYNTMTTPRGGRYDLTLADGTHVFLNAASSITYPTRFSGKSRTITITGEAYFEVTKNPKMPFVVEANGTETQVLGTHFDVMAYQDEPYVKTTLVEGAVKFKAADAEVLLKPGQQAVLPENSTRINVQEANIEEVLAWKNGYFIFQDEEIRSIMRKVSRWYDVDVTYESNLKYLSYGGSVSQYKNISDLLKVLQSTGTIHFKIEGRRVIVMK